MRGNETRRLANRMQWVNHSKHNICQKNPYGLKYEINPLTNIYKPNEHRADCNAWADKEGIIGVEVEDVEGDKKAAMEHRKIEDCYTPTHTVCVFLVVCGGSVSLISSSTATDNLDTRTHTNTDTSGHRWQNVRR